MLHHNLGVVHVAVQHMRALAKDRTVSLCILSMHPGEVTAILASMVATLASGPGLDITCWCEPCEPVKAEFPNSVKWARLGNGAWQFVIVSPRALEMCGEKAFRQYCLTSLGMVRHTPDARIFLPCVYEKTLAPCAIRFKMFESLPVSEDIGPPFGAEQAIASLEDIGIMDAEMIKIESFISVAEFISNSDPDAHKAVAEWLRINVEMCKRALPNEVAVLRKLCDPGSQVIRQDKALYILHAAPGFNHDDLAQPSPQAWWPHGDRVRFRNNGLETWNAEREQWIRPVPNHTHVPLPKMSSRQLTDLVETLATTQDRIELPQPMRLDDLLDVLVDVWDGLEE